MNKNEDTGTNPQGVQKSLSLPLLILMLIDIHVSALKNIGYIIYTSELCQ
jgi:hypothetical protein